MQVEVIGDIETALRFFKKIVGKDGIHTQIRRRLAFVKPSEKRKAKEQQAARRRVKVEQRKERYGQPKRLTRP